MKRSTLPLLAACGAIAGAAVCHITKSRQEAARKEGRHVPYGPYEACIKRPLDAALSGTALIVLSPLMLMIGALVRSRLGTPILFEQARPGLGEKLFKIRKFRTMTDARGADGELLPDKQCLTAFGSFLRSTSLDELPELWNILCGEMAIVDPRPLLPEYLPRYNSLQKRRHDVRPGLTGLAQVSGRNGISWDEKFQNDLEYIKKITFCGDARIIARTVLAVLKRMGINSSTSATMEIFMGSEGEKTEYPRHG